MIVPSSARWRWETFEQLQCVLRSCDLAGRYYLACSPVGSLDCRSLSLVGQMPCGTTAAVIINKFALEAWVEIGSSRIMCKAVEINVLIRWQKCTESRIYNQIASCGWTWRRLTWSKQVLHISPAQLTTLLFCPADSLRPSYKM